MEVMPNVHIQWPVTARAKRNSTTRHSPFQPPRILVCSAADPKWKMFMAVILQSVFEQAPELVVASGLKKGEREKIVDAAKEYVASQDFVDLCVLVGVDVSFMRTLAPIKAKAAYETLMSEGTAGATDSKSRKRGIK